VRIIVNATGNIAVIQMRLPYLDRRSLSQAWFSALRLASDGKPPTAADRRLKIGARDSAARPAASWRATVERVSPAPQEAAGRPSRRASQAEPPAHVANRVAWPPRRIAATQAPGRAHSYPPARASFALGLEGARVQILVRRDGTTLHVLALCAARHVELVRRALACADLHLRARGEVVCSSVRELAAEEVRA
jgi:hypothetical protein